MIRDMYARKADCKNYKVQFKPYIPPKFFEQFVAISRICAERREADPDLRMQMCFNTKDIEVLFKKRGGMEPFKVVGIDEFIGKKTIPSFDGKIKWRFQQDCPP